MLKTTSVFTALPVPVPQGGTGQSSLPAGYVLLGNGSAPIASVAPGASGNILTSNGTTWVSTFPGSINLSSPPPIGNVTPNTGQFTTLTATGTTNLGTGSASYLQVTGGSTVNLDATAASGNIDLRFSSRASGSIIFRTAGGTTQALVAHTASAVNYVQVTGGSTGNYPSIVGTGSDASVGLQLAGKGGTIDFRNNGVGTAVQFSVAFTASSVNYLSATGSGVSGNAPRLYAVGSDTNISMAFQSKGTGAIDLAAGSSGVNISNGGTVTAITTTANGSLYTSLPSIAISAPTTAGGVQATASVASMFTSSATIASGGSGYVVGDTIDLVGGTISGGGVVGRYSVTSVSAGAITAVTRVQGNYSVLPTNPVSVTGGSGTGATLNVNYTFQSATITNAGSGYVEQPTVTFSGGGGSGAAAYATVGSGTTVRSLGSPMSFVTPGGEQFRVQDSASQTVNYWRATGGSTTNWVLMYSEGADTNVSQAFVTKGTGSIIFSTTSSGNSQLRVSHTASAVNYVQVTGAATTARPALSAQGSDTNIGLNLVTKGSSGIFMYATGGSNVLMTFAHSTNGVNYFQSNNAAAGAAPNLQAIGTDTNIDLALTPKGTGNVRFGTYTANMALTVQGYIEIKDAGGTIRKLAVIA